MGGEQRESAEGLGQGKPTKGALGSFCALITFPGPFLELDLAPGSTVGGGGGVVGWGEGRTCRKLSSDPQAQPAKCRIALWE